MNPSPAAVFEARPANLALIYQEVFTAVVRLRSDRQQVSDAASFRAHMRQLIQKAEHTAQTRGYTSEDIRLATFAVVAFLDETILNLHRPVFGDWPRKPLQEELFGGHVAGEIFFQSLQRLLGRNDSVETADVLEVLHLSLLLGYRGKYGVGGQAELQGVTRNVADKVRRIRQDAGQLSPAWAPRDGLVRAQRDPWLKRLTYIAAGCLLVALLLFTAFKLSLRSGVSDLESVVAEARR